MNILDEDEDVLREKSKALKQVDWKAAVCVKNLTKVRNINSLPTFSIKKFVC